MARVGNGASVAERELTLEGCVFRSPVGPLALVARGDKLVAAGFTDNLGDLSVRHPDDALREVDALEGISERLERYFDGELGAIDEIDTDPLGTPRKRAAWQVMRTVGPAPMSYRDLSLRMESPASARSAARACATNPVALVVPCHRFIGRDGKMHGYHWGLGVKVALLEHERRFI